MHNSKKSIKIKKEERNKLRLKKIRKYESNLLKSLYEALEWQYHPLRKSLITLEARVLILEELLYEKGNKLLAD